jgi:molybdenum-dependent DNA-binding transcriptional regulator ModE
MNAKLYFMLDVRRLRILHAVSAYGSVTGAAASLGYSASAVSQQLAALEREVGMRLTERAGRGIELTPAAIILVAHTDALLARLDAAESDLAALRDQVSGRVALAAFPSAAATIVPAAWAALARSAPQVRIELIEMEPDESLPATSAARPTWPSRTSTTCCRARSTRCSSGASWPATRSWWPCRPTARWMARCRSAAWPGSRSWPRATTPAVRR